MFAKNCQVLLFEDSSEEKKYLRITRIYNEFCPNSSFTLTLVKFVRSDAKLGNELTKKFPALS